MNTSQKTIKYAAMGFAIVLTISILSLISAVAYIVFQYFNSPGSEAAYPESSNSESFPFGSDKEIEYMNTSYDFEQTYSEQDVENIYITSDTGTLYILTGDELKVTYENADGKISEFECSLSGESLIIKNKVKKSNFLNTDMNAGNSIINIYLPTDFHAEEVTLKCGAGIISVDALSADELYISSGAGKASLNNIFADECKIDGGVGKVEFTDSCLNDLKASCGVGNITYHGSLTGTSKISGGIGSIDLTLTGDFEDYEINLSTGLGNISINGKKYTSSTKLNAGAENVLKLDSGIGKVNLRFSE